MFALLPTKVWLPVKLYVAPSPSAQPVSVASAVSPFTSAFPSYTLLRSALFNVTLALLITRLPLVVFTMNCAVTSFPDASFTTAVPVMLFV